MCSFVCNSKKKKNSKPDPFNLNEFDDFNSKLQSEMLNGHYKTLKTGTNSESTSKSKKSDLRSFIYENFDVSDYNSSVIEKLEKIGHGGFSNVLRAIDHSNSNGLELIALKYLIDYQNIEPLKRELMIYKTLKTIDNENQFVQMKKIYKDKKQFILSMEWGEGTLKEVIRLRQSVSNPYSEAEILYILSYLVLGLLKIHKNNVYHQDIKPENMFLFNYEAGKCKYKFGDYGASINLEQNQEKVRIESRKFGTPFYCPPEIKNKNQNESYYWPSKYDIYSLGIVVLEMMGVDMKKIEEFTKYNDLSLITVPNENYQILLKILLSMLEKDPKSRISTQELNNLILKANENFTINVFDLEKYDYYMLKCTKSIATPISYYSPLSTILNVFEVMMSCYINGLNKSEIESKFESMSTNLSGTMKNFFFNLMKYYGSIFLQINHEANLPNNLNEKTKNNETLEKFSNIWDDIQTYVFNSMKLITRLNFNVISYIIKSTYQKCDPFFIRREDFELCFKRNRSKCIDYDKTAKFLHKKLEELFETRNIQNQFLSFHLSFGIGLFQKRNGNLDIALAYLKLGHLICEKLFGRKDKIFAYCLIHLSQIYRELGEIEVATQFDKEADNICLSIGTDFLLALSLNNKSLLCYTLGEYQNSKHFIEECIKKNSHFNLEFISDILHYNYGEITFHLKDFDTALVQYELSLKKTENFENLIQSQSDNRLIEYIEGVFGGSDKKRIELLTKIQIEKINLFKYLVSQKSIIDFNSLLEKENIVDNKSILFLKENLKENSLPLYVFNEIYIRVNRLKNILFNLKENFSNFPYSYVELYEILSDIKEFK